MEPATTGSWAKKAQSWVTDSPLRIAIVAVVAISAVAVGALLAASLNSRRNDVGAGSPTPTSTVASPSPTPTVAPTQSPASASPTARPTAAPPTATPVPTELRLTGTWQPLPPAPAPTGLRVSGAALLPDGRIVVTHDLRYEEHGDCLVVFAPDTETWQVPDVTGPDEWDGCFATQHQFYTQPDGRLYSLSLVMDPGDPWHVEWAPWRGDDLLPDSMGSTGGRLYGPLNYSPARLYEFDVATGELTQVSEFGGHELSWVVSGTASRLFVGTHDSNRSSLLASYDPASGEWRREKTAPFQADWAAAAHGPDGWIYIPTFDDPTNMLWARQPQTGDWYRVEIPTGLPTAWSPKFVDGGDGRLYAFDPQRPYVFTPTGVAPVPIH